MTTRALPLPVVEEARVQRCVEPRRRGRVASEPAGVWTLAAQCFTLLSLVVPGSYAGDLFIPSGYGDKHLLSTDFHPEVFSAKGSHGLYPDAARHIYETIFSGDFLADDTGYGVAWDSWNNVVTVPVQPVGRSSGDLAWMNITADWGNPASGYDNPTGYCVNSRGPGALITRFVSNPEFFTLE